VERVRAVAYVLDLSREDAAPGATPSERRRRHNQHARPATQFRLLTDEIRVYNAAILDLPSLIVMNKADQVPDADVRLKEFVSAAFPDGGAPPIVITSASGGQGLDNLKARLLDATREQTGGEAHPSLAGLAGGAYGELPSRAPVPGRVAVNRGL